MRYAVRVKTYGEFCSVARSLDAVGDRWALLVVRELLFGPRRYTDLLAGLPGIGTNVLSTRLRELEAEGVVARRRVPAPTPALVYELTAEGRELKGVVDALAHWGSRRLTAPAGPDEVVEPRWFAGSIAATVDRARLAQGSTFALVIDGQQLALRVEDDGVLASEIVDETPTAVLTGSLADFFATAKGDRRASQRVELDGDRTAARRFLSALTGCMAAGVR